MHCGTSPSPAQHRRETRTPWEFQNPFRPLAGHIGAKLYLEELDMSI